MKILVFATIAVALGLYGGEINDPADYTLTGDKTVTVTSGNTLVMSGGISGSGRIIIVGGGTLVLNFL